MSEDQNVNIPETGRRASWTNYIPVIVIILISMLAASAMEVSHTPWSTMSWMHNFMGFFLLVFSMFKFFDLNSFADGFAMYDLLAKPFRPYGFLYPFLELGLGLGYLSHWNPPIIYTATLVLMGFGALGVVRALSRGLDVRCACMGTALNVPLSTVALLENISMAAMAGVMLVVTY